MRVKYRLRPNTMSEGWVAEPYEVSDADIQRRITYSIYGLDGRGNTREEAIQAMKEKLQAAETKLAMEKEKAAYYRTENREMEI